METVKMLWSKTNRWHRGLLIFLILELKLIPGGLIGFSCNDPALSHPYTGDTITWKHLFGIVMLLPLPVILIIERKYHSDRLITPKTQALRWYKEYLFGLLLNITLVQTLKLIVGSPRPHFFDTCSPSEAVTCQGSEYVPSYTCTKAHWLSQSNKSFPSGHSSLAVHAGVFLAYYLHLRAKRSNAVLSAQIVFAVSAAYCCVSRMTDHRHHWWDVLGGVALSVPILIYTIVYLCGNFKSPSEEKLLKSNTNYLKPTSETNNSTSINKTFQT